MNHTRAPVVKWFAKTLHELEFHPCNMLRVTPDWRLSAPPERYSLCVGRSLFKDSSDRGAGVKVISDQMSGFVPDITQPLRLLGGCRINH
jgi:hypothetical protein